MAMLDARFEIPDPALPRREREGVAPSQPLVPFHPKPLAADEVAGRRIEAVSIYVGTYGMGGAGFFGLHLDGGDWLVIALRGAASWMEAEGRAVEDFFYQDHKRPRPWITDDNDELGPRMAGRRITSLAVEPHALALKLDDGFTLSIDRDPAGRPIFEGSKEPRAFAAQDDLRRNVFLAPTDEIWV